MLRILIRATKFFVRHSKKVGLFFWRNKGNIAKGGVKTIATATSLGTSLATFSWPILAVATQTGAGLISTIISLISVIIMAIIVPVLGIQKNKNNTKKLVLLSLLFALIGASGFYFSYAKKMQEFEKERAIIEQQNAQKRGWWGQKEETTQPKALDKQKAEELEKQIKKGNKKKDYSIAFKAIYNSIHQFLLSGFLPF